MKWVNFRLGYGTHRCKTEFFLAGVVFTWGLWILVPVWNSFEISPVFIIMKQIMPEYYWGGLATLLGAAELLFVHFDNLRIRQVFSVINIFFFSFLSVLYGIGGLGSPAIPVNFSLAVLSLLAYIELTTQLQRTSKKR